MKAPTAVAAILLALLAGTLCPKATSGAQSRRLDPAAMDRSLELGRQYMLNSVRPDGSFVYEIDATTGADAGTRHAVREAGALWALAILHRHRPNPETRDAIVRAIKRQDGFSRRTAAGAPGLCEPDAPEWTTGSVALHVLGVMEFLAADTEGLDPAFRAKCERDLADTVKFLVSLRQPGGRFYSQYRCADGRGTLPPSPYYDGETLLALARFAKDHEDDQPLRAVVLESAAAMYGEYVRSPLRVDPNSEKTKGFYQWGSMSFFELYTSGWPGTQPYAARTIAMARWMIDVQGVTDRSGNAAYAYEGLAAAYELARLTKDAKNQQHIGNAIETGLSKLMTWQIGSPLADAGAVPSSFRAAKAKGGVLSAPGERRLRIDVIQHQMHATLLARMLLFRPDEAADGR